MPADIPFPATIIVPSQDALQQLRAYCEEHGLQLILPEDVVNPKSLDTTARKPIPPFKTLCGNYWLTPKGMISAASAYQCLLDYTRYEKLKQPDGSIVLDTTLREIFPTMPQRIYQHELVEMANLAVSLS